jgi:UDP-N-acetylmuramyl pentapeptide synthase
MLQTFRDRLIKSVLKYLTRQLWLKFQSQYKNQKLELKTVLVAGTVGKSSQVMLLKDAFRYLGYRVWSGTKPNKNFNTLSGLIMTLAEFEKDLEQANLVQKASFLVAGFWVLFFKTWNLGQKAGVLVQEVAVDHQNEMQDFIQIFKPKVDWIVLTSLTAEHLQGFESVFDSSTWKELKSILPPQYLNKNGFDFEDNPNITAIEKNCYLEQLKLLKLADSYLVPTENSLANFDIIKKQSNLSNSGPKEAFSFEIINKAKIARLADKTLVLDGLKTPSHFLFPESFAIQVLNASEISSAFGMTNSAFQEVLLNLELPNGRFGLFEGKNQTKIVDGSYNSDPASVDAFLKLMMEVGSQEKNILVLGEMRELGESSKREHQKVLNQIEDLWQTKLELKSKLKVFLLGKSWNECTYDRKLFLTYDVVSELIDYFKQFPADAGSWFWIKGSQNTIFLEALVESLLLDAKDANRLARRGEYWDGIRSEFLDNGLNLS